jgi:RNA polymerase sigma-70 factor (ECF subfamily)
MGTDPHSFSYNATMPTNPGIQRQATAILTRITTGDDADSAILSELLYDELKSLARQLMNSERADHTLEPTALVHEVFLRLINTEEVNVNSKDHFMMLAAQVMRRVLIDHARASKRNKRGGDHNRVPLTIADPESNEPISPETLLSIDDALCKLRELDERKASLVELRFFAGLDEEHAARILGIARSTASSDWRFARAWLLRQLDTNAEDAT